MATTIYIDKYNYTGSIISSSNNDIFLNTPVIDSKYNLIQLRQQPYILYYIQNYISSASTSNYKSFINCNIYFTLISGYLNQINIYARNSGNINKQYFYVGNSKTTQIVNNNYQFMVQLPN